MEGLKQRLYWMGALFVAVGIYITITGSVVHERKSEKWMESQTPTSVDGIRFSPGQDNPRQSYTMDKMVYDILLPFGIVCRDYIIDGRRYDVVLIASASKYSFHDPRVCFSAQGYEIDGEQTVSIPTRTRGTIQATYAQLKGSRGNADAIYLYHGPEGFVPTTLDLKMSIFKHELATGHNTDGVFYRFVTESNESSKSKLESFASDFMDQALISSNGYF